MKIKSTMIVTLSILISGLRLYTVTQETITKLEKEHKEEESKKNMPALLQSLPHDLRREILRINANTREVLNIPAFAKEILNLAATNKTLRSAINNPQNMLTILKTLPKAGALYLAEKLEKTPGVQSKEVQEWLNSLKLENGKELFDAVNTQHPNFNTISTLLKNPNSNVNWENRNQDSTSALIQAARDGHTQIVRSLLNAGANPNIQDGTGWTALMQAANRRHSEIVKLLLAAGASVDVRNHNNETALLRASSASPEIVTLLLAAGANIEAQDYYGITPLFEASYAGNIEIVKILLAAGANPQIHGRVPMIGIQGSALDVARTMGHTEIVKLLQDAMARRR